MRHAVAPSEETITVDVREGMCRNQTGALPTLQCEKMSDRRCSARCSRVTVCRVLPAITVCPSRLHSYCNCNCSLMHTILSLRFCRQLYRLLARMQAALRDLGARRSTLAAACGGGLRASTAVKMFPLFCITKDFRFQGCSVQARPAAYSVNPLESAGGAAVLGSD